MKELSDNILIVKSMNFAIRCVRLARYIKVYMMTVQNFVSC